MLSKEYEGSFYEIKTLKNEFISSGLIDKITDDGIEISDPTGPMPIVSFKTPVKMAVYNSKLGFRMMAGQVYLSNRDFIRVVDVIDFIDYERRRFFRVDTDIGATLIRFPTEEELGRNPSAKPKVLPVRVRDLSLCGTMIESGEPLEIGAHWLLELTLYKNALDRLKVVIRRIGEPGDDGSVICGAEILDLSPRTEQQLCAYLFERQRQQIRKAKS